MRNVRGSCPDNTREEWVERVNESPCSFTTRCCGSCGSDFDRAVMFDGSRQTYIYTHPAEIHTEQTEHTQLHHSDYCFFFFYDSVHIPPEGFACMLIKSTYTVEAVSPRCHGNRARPSHCPRALISQAAEQDERRLVCLRRDVICPYTPPPQDM